MDNPKEGASRMNSNAKGKRFEREVAVLLTEWAGFDMVRTPMSGAWSGCDVDIWPESQAMYFPFAVECKKAEGWDLFGLLSGKGPFQNWWSQACNQSNRLSKKDGRAFHPMLIFSRNRYPIMVAVDYYWFNPNIGKIATTMNAAGVEYPRRSGIPSMTAKLLPACQAFTWEDFSERFHYPMLMTAFERSKALPSAEEL